MPGWGTQFGDAPKGLDLGCGPPALVPTRSIAPVAEPAAAPGAFPAAGPGFPSGTGTTGAMAGRKVGQEKPSPRVRRRRELSPPGSFHPHLSGGCSNINAGSRHPWDLGGPPHLALTPLPWGTGCSQWSFPSALIPIG